LADYLLSNNNNDTTTSKIPILLAAQDRSKDQSYFLSGVPGEAFSNILFPLGDLYKTTPVPNPREVVDPYNIDNDDITSGSSTSSASLSISLSSSDQSKSLRRTPSVRELAQQAKLPTASKRDSMGICFIGRRKHGDFINEFIAAPSTEPSSSSTSSLSSSMMASTEIKTGELSTRQRQLRHECINVEDGTVVATFDPSTSPSLTYATIGQGAKLSGASQKWFIVDKCGHQLWICPGTHHPALYSNRIYIRNFHWILGGRPPPLPFRAKCRIRHLQPLVDCEIIVSHSDSDSPGGNSGTTMYEVRLDSPLRGIARGQVCAIYSGGRAGDLVCLGGGPIEQRGPTYWEMQRDLPQILHPAGLNDLSLATIR
jgi:tRNA U34 2-thiouridine synthase MnmA/TrmU